MERADGRTLLDSQPRTPPTNRHEPHEGGVRPEHPGSQVRRPTQAEAKLKDGKDPDLQQALELLKEALAAMIPQTETEAQ
jgi:hypothetical protein